MGRATATVLFTDLVGSTELRGRLGEEGAEELRRTHDRLLSEVVDRHGGRLVKGLGDGIMATFIGASDAVAAAVAMQQGIDRLNRSGKIPAPLAVRVGLSAGDVTFEDDDVHGTPVIEASRLCGVAGGGEILAAEVVRILAGSSGGHDVWSVGPLELKGLDHPVPSVRIGWEPAVVSSIPMPALLTDVGRIFVGRDAELERLGQLWKEAAAGERRIALLAGEPGVGKTRLAAELAKRVHEEGGVVLAGRCNEDLGVPFQPFVEALRHFVDRAPAHDVPERLGRYGGELVRLVPELAERGTGLAPPLRSDPETERYRLFDGVVSWLGAVSDDRPVLLVLDDLQWAAKPTLLLLRHVVGSPEFRRVFVLGTYRDTDLGHDHPLAEVIADLRRQGGLERVSVHGFDSSGVAAYMEQAAGRMLDSDDVALVRAVHEETQGNPFFVREVFRHLAETGAIERRGDRWTISVALEKVGIPESVRDVVGRRLSRLSEQANRAFRVAAVVGSEFDPSVLQAATGLDEDSVLSLVDEAAQARLIIEEGDATNSYRFAHALVRDTLYRDLSSARRSVLHRRVAEAIETVHGQHLDDYLPALAHHWAQASALPFESAKAVQYATWAGDRALAQLAHAEAAERYRSGLEILTASPGKPDEARRLSLLLSLGEAERRAGEPAFRQTLLAAVALARERGDASALARAALANRRDLAWATTGRVDEEEVAALRAALGAVGVSEASTRALLLARLATETVFAGDDNACRRYSDEALALARGQPDRATLAMVLTTRCLSVSGPDAIAVRAAAARDLLPVTEALDDPVALYWGLLLQARSALECAEREAADGYLERAQRTACATGQPILRWFDAIHRLGVAVATSDAETAERLGLEVLELGTATGMPETTVTYAMNLMLLRIGRGDLAEAEDLLRQATSDLPGFELPSAMLTWLYAETGRLDDARDLLTVSEGRGFARPPRNHFYLAAVVSWSTAVATLGDTQRAAALLEVLRPFPEHIVAPANMIFGSLSHTQGVLEATVGHVDEAAARFAVAEARHVQLGTPAWLARTRLEWACVLLARRQAGDAERARELLGQALGTARELGLATFERRAVELLA